MDLRVRLVFCVGWTSESVWFSAETDSEVHLTNLTSEFVDESRLCRNSLPNPNLRTPELILRLAIL